ncbi:hypothetical protein [Dyadobacter luteus]|nr:hypothetical protein [Dyadobacter luteus]
MRMAASKENHRHDFGQSIWRDGIRHQTPLQEFIEAFMLNHELMERLQSAMYMYPVILSGEHYWRTISENGIDFDYPERIKGKLGCLITFSRIMGETEVLCVINLNRNEPFSVYVTLDNELHPTGSKMTSLNTSAGFPQELNVEDRNGKAIRVTVPARGLVMYR